MELTMVLEVFVVGVAAGGLGALVGIGGGILLVPFMTLILGLPIHTAIGSSLIAVVATSCTSASVLLRKRLTNVKLGIILGLTSAVGAILGGLTATHLNHQTLSIIFAVTMIIIAYSILNKVTDDNPIQENYQQGMLGSSFYDEHLHKEVQYQVKKLPLGLPLSFIGGNISGLLGIGGGAINVPLMVLGMGVPLKAAVATSNYMIGITAISSAFIFYARGFVNPLIAAPTAIGIFLGATISSFLVGAVKSKSLAKLLAAILVLLSIQMALSAFGIKLR